MTAEKNVDALDKRVADYMHKTGAHPRSVAVLFNIHPKVALYYYYRYYTESYAAYANRLRSERVDAARAYRETHPEVKPYEIARLFELPIKIVYSLRLGNSKRRACAYKPVTQSEMRRIMDVIKSRPVAPIRWYQDATGRGEQVIRKAIGLLCAEGFDCYEVRDKYIDDYFDKHPRATYTDAAAHFGVAIGFITSTVAKLGRKPGEDVDAEDKRLEAAAISPPPDIQREIDERDGFGVSLPPEAMRRFCEHHRRKVAARELAYSLQNGKIYDLERI